MPPEDLIARRVSCGYTETESSQLLADLVKKHDGDNLVSALVYNGFGSEAQIERWVG